MCGRFTIRNPLAQVIATFKIAGTPFDPAGWQRHYNAAPSQHLPVIRIDSKGERSLDLVQWGLIPSWTNGTPKLQPINARGETVATSGMFRQAFDRRRCLIPVDGFYEWRGAKPPKQPFFIHQPDDTLFAFAGLWERWKPDPNAEPVDTFTIVTTTPNTVMEPIHNRMPVILASVDYDRWLDRQVSGRDVEDLIKPFRGTLETWPVSTKVNNVRNQGPELVAAVE